MNSCQRMAIVARAARLRPGWRTAAWATALIGLAGCAGTPQPVERDAVLPPVIACAALQGQTIPASAIGLPTRGARLLSAVQVAATPAMADTRAGSAGGMVQALPDYCKVTGEIAPVDPAAPPIRFQVDVPTDWNGKSIQVGGGGINGNIPANLAAVTGGGSPVSAAQPPGASYPLARGYATFGGDSGHQDPVGGQWALNDEAWTNFAYAGLKKTRDAAYAVIARLHGSVPRLGYFMGSSQGGREALEVAQRFPADYDGVVSTVPLIGYTAHIIAKARLAQAQTGAGWIPPEKSKVVGAEVLRQCDGLDGIVDGVISHYRGCAARFDPAGAPAAYAAIRCPGGADTGPQCLSDAQIAVVQQMHAPTTFGFPLAHGLRDFPGYWMGREAIAWLNITPRPARPAAPALGQPGVSLQFGVLKDPGMNLLDFSADQARDRIQAASALIDSTNPDLSAFFARGGRLIVKSSGSDYGVNPAILARYYETVVARFGQETVDRHVRYYVLPNVGHSADGVGATGEPIPHSIDMTRLITDWVERGIVPPDAPVATTQLRSPPYTVTASKPFCRYPRYPRYQSGDRLQAASYRCVD